MKNGLSNGTDKTLPKTAGETQAEIELYTHIKTVCDAVRVSDRIDFCEVAVREIKRCDARLASLKKHMKRFSRRSQEKATGKIPVNA